MIPLLVIIVLAIVYYAGPKVPVTPLSTKLPVISVPLDSLTEYIRNEESHYPVKKDNESIILWGDSVGQKTEYVLLYLHGFSASRHEGYPVTHNFVKEFKVNAYLPRLAEHGLNDKEPLLNMTPERLYESARAALVIAHKLGNKVIIMGTSTGSTLALMLAADFPEMVSGLILYSPNIQIKEKSARLLSGPWGLQIARLAFDGAYRITDDADDSEISRYWYNRYRVESIVYLQQLLDMRMNKEEFEKVKVPVFLGIYYKDRKHQDQTVEVKAALRMFDELGTPENEKIKYAFPEAGDHVIACELTSQAVPEVQEQTFTFAREILKLK